MRRCPHCRAQLPADWERCGCGEPNYRICWTCPLPHIENCPDCLGFGRLATGAPVLACEAFDGPLPTIRPCATCGSVTEHAADAFYAGSIIHITSQEISSLRFDHRSNFLRWLTVLHELWGDDRIVWRNWRFDRVREAML